MDDLIAQVKRKLNITWNDAGTEARIKDVMETARRVVAFRIGINHADAEDFDFSVPGIENALFLAYCLYEWNHMTDDFEANYAGMMMQARALHFVKNSPEDSEGGDGA